MEQRQAGRHLVNHSNLVPRKAQLQGPHAAQALACRVSNHSAQMLSSSGQAFVAQGEPP